MSSLPEQRNTIPSSWWVRLCQWLWSQRGFIWSILIMGLLICIAANWLTSSTSIFKDTPLETILLWIREHFLLAGLIGTILLLLTLLVGTVNHLANISTRPASIVSEDKLPSLPPTPIEVKVSLTPSLSELAMESEQVKQLVTIWNVPRRNPFFTGREELLKRLHDNMMNKEATALTQGISGLGGIGKTQVAVEYAYRYRDEYHDVFWVNAATPDTFITSFLDFARSLNLPEKDEQNQKITIQAVKRWLEQHDRWLLILDNADDLTLLEDFFPTGSKGHILLTTRAQALGTLASGIDVEKMCIEEGKLLLLRGAKVLAREYPLAQASIEDCTAAESIVQEMDGLPLALDQAGAFIEETRCSVSDYLINYHQRQEKLLKRRGATGKEYPGTVATTWSLSFEEVERQNPMAADLLQVCALLAPDAIPEELLIKGASELGPLLQPLATDAALFNDAIATLLCYSLIKRNAQERTLSIHRLVQAVLKDQMDKAAYMNWAKRTVQAVNKAFPYVTPLEWPLCERLLPHALICIALIEEQHLATPEVARLLNQTGYYLKEHARYQEAESLLQQALRMREQLLGPNHPDTALSLNDLAMLYDAQGNEDQAEPLFKQALSIREQQLGPEHPDTADSLKNLAVLYSQQGKYDQAEPLLERALTIRKQKPVPEYFRTAGVLNELASLYHAKGKYEQAESYFKQALAIREQQPDPQVPGTPVVLNNLARLYMDQRKYEQAEPLFKRALEIHEQRMRPHHLYTAYILRNLARLYMDQRKYEQAEPLLKRALAIREQRFGAENLNTATSLEELALLYLAEEKYEQAEPLLQRTLAIYEQQLGPEHQDTAIIRQTYQVLARNMAQKRKGQG